MVPPGFSSPARSASSMIAEADPVLHRAAGIGVLRLAVDRRPDAGADRGQAGSAASSRWSPAPNRTARDGCGRGHGVASVGAGMTEVDRLEEGRGDRPAAAERRRETQLGRRGEGGGVERRIPARLRDTRGVGDQPSRANPRTAAGARAPRCPAPERGRVLDRGHRVERHRGLGPAVLSVAAGCTASPRATVPTVRSHAAQHGESHRRAQRREGAQRLHRLPCAFR